MVLDQRQRVRCLRLLPLLFAISCDAGSIGYPVRDDTSPTVPQNLDGTAASASAIHLTWAASTDNVGVAGYVVYRGGSRVAAVTELAYRDTGLTAGASYTHAVAAFDAAGNLSALSAPVTVTTQDGTSDNVIVFDGFETGDLSEWDDGVDPAKHRVVADPNEAFGGSHYLEMTYPAGGDGGWLTQFFMPGYREVRASYRVKFPNDWSGGTKLLLLRGSRIDDQWSSFGVAGSCPEGNDFFATNVVAEADGSPGSTRFYTYYLGMAREPDGSTCWGRFGNGTETYFSPLAMSRGAWHLVEFQVRLNDVGQANGEQRFWIDGELKGEWTSLEFRTTTDLKLNSLTLEGSTEPVSSDRRLYVDDVQVIAIAEDGAPGPTPPADTTAPSVPQQLNATAVSSSRVDLSWNASSDDVAVMGYRIYRDGSQVASVTSPGYSDAALSASTTYSYAVAAYDAALNTSSQSAPASVTTEAGTSPPPAGQDEPVFDADTDFEMFHEDWESYSTTSEITAPGVGDNDWIGGDLTGIELLASGGVNNGKNVHFDFQAPGEYERLLRTPDFVQPGGDETSYDVQVLQYYFKNTGATYEGKVVLENVRSDGYRWLMHINEGAPNGAATCYMDRNWPHVSLDPEEVPHAEQEIWPGWDLGTPQYRANKNAGTSDALPAYQDAVNDGAWHRFTWRWTRTGTLGQGRIEGWWNGVKFMEYIGDDPNWATPGGVGCTFGEVFVHEGMSIFPYFKTIGPSAFDWSGGADVFLDEIRSWAPGEGPN